jgi:PTS system nitrogen regulatory IIA component
MNYLENLLTVDRVLCKAQVGSKKRVLELLAKLLAGAEPGLSELQIFDGLLGRERLGSTGLGHSMGLPHGRMSGLSQPAGAFVTLESGVDFDAPDRAPVDMLFGLLVPENCNDDHLQILAGLAEMFSDPELRQHLREETDRKELFYRLVHWRP